MAETINTQTTGYECVGIEKIEQTYEGLFDNKPNIITIYLTNGDTHQFKVMNGSQGVGIDRIEQRQTSTVSGGRNEFAIILTNGKEYTFSTYNGSGGSGSSGSFNQVLQQLNNLLMPSGKSYLYYNGSSFEWKSPDGSTGGGTADLSEYSWWGRRFDPASKSITGEMSGVTGIEFQSTNGETVIRKKLHLDNNGDLCFDGNFYATGGITALGSSGGTSGGSGVSLGTLLTQLNNENPFPTANGQVLTYDGNNFVWKTPTGGSGGSTTGGIRIKRNGSTLKDSNGNVLSCTSINFKYGENWNSTPILINSDNEISVDLSVVANNGNGSSSSTLYPFTIYNGSSDNDYITYDGSSAAYLKFKSGFSISKVGLGYEISASVSGGSTSTSVSWTDVTNKPNTFTPSSHTHSTSDISDLSNYVQGVKVNNATNADRLLNSRTIWGQSFNGTGDINGNLYMGSAGGGSIQLWMNNGNMLDRTNNTLHIAYGLKESSDGEINLDAYATKVYTDNMSKHYDFKSNVFDINSNQIHFGSETNGGRIYWDAANNAFKIEGNVYATGGITALGVSNNATTSNNVDFTFRSVTANTFNVKNSIQLSDKLSLVKYGNDVYLGNDDGISHNIYLDGMDQNYYLSSQGRAYFSGLNCDTLNFSGCTNFEIVNAGSTTFTIQFKYNSKTYQFTPSGGSVTVS